MIETIRTPNIEEGVMTASENATLMREGYEAFAAGDLERIREMFDTDIVWHEPGHSPIAGDYQGTDAVLGFFGKLFEGSGGTFRAEPVEILADDDRAMVLQHTTATRNGKTLDVTQPVLWEIRDGKPYDVRIYAYDMDEHDAFWS
jgi:uncharacterized protein